MRKYIIAIAFFTICCGLQAQKDKSDRREEFKALEIAYITDKLQLTPEESQKFWPIHNAFDEKYNDLRRKSRKSLSEEVSEEEALNYLDERISAEEQILVYKKAYIEDLKNVLSNKKIAILFEIEHEFKRKMLRKIRDKRKSKSRE